MLRLLAAAAGLSSAAAEPVVGAIRWDAWNGAGGGDRISSHVLECMQPEHFHWRLPFFAQVDEGGNVTFDGDRQSVMDRELRYAHSAGIRFFAYDTYCVYPDDNDTQQCDGYWGGPHPTSVHYQPSDPAYGLKLHLSSAVRDLVNVSLMLLGASPAVPKMRARYLPLFKDRLFQRVVGGRPLVFLFQAGENEAAMNGGWAEWKEQWDAFRSESVAQGTGNPYFVAVANSFEAARELYQRLGFDAVSAYALPGGNLTGMPFADLREKARTFWDAAASSATPAVAPVPTGWDPRPRAEHPVPWVNEGPMHYTTPTAGELTGLFTDAVRWVKANPAVAEAEAALVYAWNENTEGGWLLPTLGNGTARVDAVAKALRNV